MAVECFGLSWIWLCGGPLHPSLLVCWRWLKGICLTHLKDLRYLISRLAFSCLEGKQTLVIGSSLDDLEVTLFLSALRLIQVSV